MVDKPNNRRRVLVVEDEADISTSLVYALGASGYEARAVDRGEAALAALATFHPDLVLLDIMLPDRSGLDICRAIRGAGNGEQQPAVIIVSARAQEIDRVVGFEIGADDYVVKPFSVRELMLRIDARLRVREAAAKHVGALAGTNAHSLTLRNLRVDETAHRAHVSGTEIHLSALEMRVLVFLLRSPGRVRTRRELLTEVWGYNPEVESRTIDTHIKRLRDKLGSAADLLQTVRGIGFRIAEPGPPGET